MRLVSTLAASDAGNVSGFDGSQRSTTVMVHCEKISRRARANAVLRPKTPEPTMRIEEGGEKAPGGEVCEVEKEGGGGEIAAGAIGRRESGSWEHGR